ncbi:hypothetical protein ScPMuIL_015452 [Solemya velum]
MVNFCAMMGCSNRSDRDKKSFSRLPTIITSQGEQTKQLSEKRQQAWLTAISRKNLTEKSYPHTRVCQDHFILGHASKLYDTNNPDWAPSSEHRALQHQPHKRVDTNAPLLDSFQNNEEKVKFYTGLPNFLTLMAIFDLIKDHLNDSSRSMLTPFQQMMRCDILIPVAVQTLVVLTQRANGPGRLGAQSTIQFGHHVRSRPSRTDKFTMLEAVLSFGTVTVFLFTLFLGLAIYHSITRPRGPPLLPFIACFRKDTRNMFREMRDKHGDIYSLNCGYRHVIIMNGYDVLKEMFVKNGELSSERPFLSMSHEGKQLGMYNTYLFILIECLDTCVNKPVNK